MTRPVVGKYLVTSLGSAHSGFYLFGFDFKHYLAGLLTNMGRRDTARGLALVVDDQQICTSLLYEIPNDIVAALSQSVENGGFAVVPMSFRDNVDSIHVRVVLVRDFDKPNDALDVAPPCTNVQSVLVDDPEFRIFGYFHQLRKIAGHQSFLDELFHLRDPSFFPHRRPEELCLGQIVVLIKAPVFFQSIFPCLSFHSAIFLFQFSDFLTGHHLHLIFRHLAKIAFDFSWTRFHITGSDGFCILSQRCLSCNRADIATARIFVDRILWGHCTILGIVQVIPSHTKKSPKG
mmetsp:Transcript_14444/g.33604  ORF Transcript_14444/g.33604 Transcript_14444/m.33604 type:complete len:290 (+) Transcript_14444:975-1844(+)